jgi:hypothetical protein
MAASSGGFTVTPVMAIILFIVLIAICVIVCIVVNPTVFKDSRGNTFLIMLNGLSIIIVILFYLALLQIYQQQIDLATVQETATVNDSLFNFADSIRAAAKTNPDFVLSISPLMRCPSGDVPKCVDRLILSHQEFSVWEGVIGSVGFANFDPLAYTTAFLQRANSQELYEDWHYLKIDFNSKTQKFGDFLFAYGLPITQQEPQTYVQVAKKLLRNPEYQALLQS